jgi:copper chaperone NosL
MAPDTSQALPGGKGDKHRHLPMAGSTPTASPSSVSRRMLGSRWLVIALTLAAASLYVASFFVPWWRFTLFAPQYPGGLSLEISLTGLSGDVREIDMLNHYIGMGHLEEAARVERALAGYGVGAIGVIIMLLALLPGRKLSPLIVVPGVFFPATFVADSFYWLYRFGHHLDPRAPLKIKAFTPQLFGEGVIGQFRTVATPSLGLWLSLGALAALVLAALLRRRVCAACPRAGNCGAVCPSLLVGPGAGLPRAPGAAGQP